MNVIEVKGTVKSLRSGTTKNGKWVNLFLMVDDVMDSGEKAGQEIQIGMPFAAFNDAAEKLGNVKPGDELHLKGKIWRHKKDSWVNDLVVREVL